MDRKMNLKKLEEELLEAAASVLDKWKPGSSKKINKALKKYSRKVAKKFRKVLKPEKKQVAGTTKKKGKKTVVRRKPEAARTKE